MGKRFLKADDLSSDEIYLKLSKKHRPNKRRRWPAEYSFFILRTADNVKVGHCAFRIGHTEWSFFGGNIGYEVYEPYRGNRYAEKACRLIFKLARRHGMKYLLITCNPENAASLKTCEHLDAELIATIDLPEDNDLYLGGERRKRIYRVELGEGSFEEHV